MDRTQLDNVIRTVDGVITELGFECIEAEFNKKDNILRLFIDWNTENPEAPVSLDQCVAVNRALDENGNLDGLMPGPYTLEVSSPGVERPLRMERHFRSHIGETVNVRLREKVDGHRQLSGTLLSVGDESTITIDTDEGPVAVPLASLHKANIVFDWAAR